MFVSYSNTKNKENRSRRAQKQKRLTQSVFKHFMHNHTHGLPHNLLMTFASPALPSSEDLALTQFQKFCRILRSDLKNIEKQFSYLWVAGIGVKRGYHIHMTLHWPVWLREQLIERQSGFWDVEFLDAQNCYKPLTSSCSSIDMRPITTTVQDYEDIAFYLSGHVSKHLKQPKRRCFGQSHYEFNSFNK